MIAEGCIMARICHTNNCPVGVTTQKEELRKKFPGTPQNVVTFFEVRHCSVRGVFSWKKAFCSKPFVTLRENKLGPETDVAASVCSDRTRLVSGICRTPGIASTPFLHKLSSHPPKRSLTRSPLPSPVIQKARRVFW